MTDLKELLNKFNQEYEFLYEHHDNVAGYREAVEAFDEDIKNDKFQKLVNDFVNIRPLKDPITSDREAAAFEFACESLGLYP